MKFLLFVTWLIVNSKSLPNFRSRLFCRGINKKLQEIYDRVLSQNSNLCCVYCILQIFKNENTFEVSVVEDILDITTYDKICFYISLKMLILVEFPLCHLNLHRSRGNCQLLNKLYNKKTNTASRNYFIAEIKKIVIMIVFTTNVIKLED